MSHSWLAPYHVGFAEITNGGDSLDARALILPLCDHLRRDLSQVYLPSRPECIDADDVPASRRWQHRPFGNRQDRERIKKRLAKGVLKVEERAVGEDVRTQPHLLGLVAGLDLRQNGARFLFRFESADRQLVEADEIRNIVARAA